MQRQATLKHQATDISKCEATCGQHPPNYCKCWHFTCTHVNERIILTNVSGSNPQLGDGYSYFGYRIDRSQV